MIPMPAATGPSFDVMRPADWTGGVIFASPHSGRDYPGWFLAESMLVTVIATLVALALVELLMPVFAAFLEADIPVNYLGPDGLALPVLGLVLVTGLLGGIYPAFFLSRFQPAAVLKANKSAAETPEATTAFRRRAPSRCARIPCSRATPSTVYGSSNSRASLSRGPSPFLTAPHPPRRAPPRCGSARAGSGRR